MDSEAGPPAYEISLRRGPRRLRVREHFPSREAARAYVRDQWATRSLGHWWEDDERAGLPGELMILAGNEAYWIRPVEQPAVCPAPQPASAGRVVAGRLTGLSFDDWVQYAFDHPVAHATGDAWYWQLERDDWNPLEEPRTAVSYLTRLFERAPGVLQPFSDAQIAQGLWFLIDNSLSNHVFPLMDPSVPWPARQRCIRSMFCVFEQVFATRCSARLQHTLTEPDPTINPLNGVCYMWWDVCPLQGNAGPSASEDFVLETEEVIDEGPAVDPFAADLEDEILEVLRQSLGLDSVACQEGALHGLGHRAYRHPVRVATIVDEFLSRRYPDWPEGALDEALRGYALAARRGYVQ